MTNDSLNAVSVDAASEASLVERRRPLAANSVNDGATAAFAPAAAAEIAAASTGPASAMAALTYPLLVVATVTPPGAAVNRVTAITAYSATRE